MQARASSNRNTSLGPGVGRYGGGATPDLGDEISLPLIHGAASGNHGASIKLLSKKMMGKRTDENCNLNRTALMMEKANRLGENFKLNLDSTSVTPRDQLKAAVS